MSDVTTTESPHTSSTGTVTSWLPPAAVLIEYKDIGPDVPDRLLQLIEGEALARRELLRNRFIEERAERKRGQYLGFGIAVLGLAGAVVVAMYLGDWPGAIGASALGGSTILGLVVAFLRGASLPDDHLNEKVNVDYNSPTEP